MPDALRCLALLLCVFAAAGTRGVVSAQRSGPAPAPDRDAMYQHLKQAQLITGLDLYPYFAHRCLVDQTYRRTISRSIQADRAIEPLQVLDDLYFVGQNAATARALRTSAGMRWICRIDCEHSNNLTSWSCTVGTIRTAQDLHLLPEGASHG
jgi:metallo-beta-lactamase class B